MPQGVRIDITGQRFEMVKVLEFSHVRNNAYWLCRCDCGKEFVTLGSSLRRGLTKSCGCLRSILKTRLRHGDADTRFYKIWCGIKVRVNNEHSHAYGEYGGRGITLCDKWMDYENFKADMFVLYQEHCSEFGEQNTTIDREDNNGGYNPENCRWSTCEEQSNNRRDNVKISYQGISYSRQGASRKFGINPDALRGRLERGWSVEDALTTPTRK